MSAVQRRHAVHHLQADDRGEFPFPQFRLDQCHQVVSLLFVLLCIGIAGDPEKLAGNYHHSGKEHVQIMADDLFERDKSVLAFNADKAGNARSYRYLDPGQRCLLVLAVMQFYQDVEGEVGDKGEGMGRVHYLGRNQWEDVLVIVVADFLLFPGGEFLVRGDGDPGGRQKFQQLLQQPFLASFKVVYHGIAVDNLLPGSAPINCLCPDAGFHLLFEPADPLHEKLVKV